MGLFSFVGGLLGGGSAKKASKKAEAAQIEYLNKALAEQSRQYDLSRSDYKPYLDIGTAALPGLGNLAGVNGADKQQAAIDALRSSPMYQSLYRNGEEALLQNASATGGIRGGNTQRGLADFGSDVLANTIQNQIATLGGLAGIGQGSTDAIAQLGASAANNRSSILGAQGQVRAGGILSRGGITSNMWNSAGGFLDGLGKSLLGAGGLFG